ncbi:sugar ABC transporter permease [Rhizobium laguerreae]|uniref:hypothetical protein n=1 Tax=Rhizobium laguerreae TaxID=1076926 RepID=UPI001C90CA85|nr:hypothetical protein [Rhizobium laguerreae]MBY3308179.1 sugar ABC transporter permease [Rhizobium laguerreae]
MVFRKTLWTTLIFTLCVTAFSVGIGWSLALLCAFAPKRTSIFRLMIFATFGIFEAVAAYIWVSIFRPGEVGLLNGLLTAVGMGQRRHLSR